MARESRNMAMIDRPRWPGCWCDLSKRNVIYILTWYHISSLVNMHDLFRPINFTFFLQKPICFCHTYLFVKTDQSHFVYNASSQLVSRTAKWKRGRTCELPWILEKLQISIHGRVRPLEKEHRDVTRVELVDADKRLLFSLGFHSKRTGKMLPKNMILTKMLFRDRKSQENIFN